jgi:pyruvate formate lyase activating enzyme
MELPGTAEMKSTSRQGTPGDRRRSAVGVSGAVVFDIQRFSVHDGPGIRTLIFFKGCPLRCAWCSNPESQLPRPQLAVLAHKCRGCGNCVAACGRGACHFGDDGGLSFQRSLCTDCGACAETCYAGARVMLGRTMSIDDVLREVRKDTVFYRTSGGGVTLGGGEPTVWSPFAAGLLRELKAEGMHTALETCGQAPYDEIEPLLPHLDLVLYDVKHMDAAQHEAHTGVTNEMILANLERLAREEVEIIVRVPVVPGINDEAENIARTAEYAARLGIAAVELLPYHRYAQDKYARLGREYALAGLLPPSARDMEELAAVVRARGLSCRVEG